MKYYRLKPEAVPFFLKKHSTSLYTIDTWEELNVDIVALDEVEEMYISYGHRDNETSSSLGGWDEKNGSHFYFTLNFPSVKYIEHDKFSKGKMTRELMNRIQQNINFFYNEFKENQE